MQKTISNLKQSVQIKHKKQEVNCLKELEIELESLILAQDERWRHA